MIEDNLLNDIVKSIVKKYGCHTIILYGSRARGESTINSDYDIIAIRDGGEFERDCRLFKGFYLDIFIYPLDTIKTPDISFIRAKDGVVLRQNQHIGDELLKKINTLFERGAPKTPDWEKHEIIAWLQKMLARAKENSIEGNFRRHWLLHELLECYFKLRNAWYLGPKESFKWLKIYDLPLYYAFEEALKQSADLESIEKLIRHVSKLS